MEQSENPIADMLAKQGSNVESNASQETQSQETSAQEEQPSNQETSEASSEEPQESQESQEAQEQPKNEESTQELDNSNAENSIEDNNSQNEESDDSGSSDGIEEKNWWDDDSEGATTTNEETSSVDYSTLSKALGIESGREGDIVKEFETIRQQNEEYKQKVEELSKEPQFADERLAQANEIAKNGGDYQEFLGLSQTDWSLVGDDELIAAIQLKPVFGDDVENMNKYMADMDPVQKRLQADQIRTQLNQEQQQAMDKIRQDAAKKKIDTDAKIRSSLDSIDSLYGVKLTSGKKKSLYDELTTGNFMKNLFYTDGKPDHKRMVENAYLLSNIKEIMKVNISRATNKGKKEVFDEASNPQVRSNNGQFVAPTKKETTAFGDYFNDLKKGGPK